MQWKIWHSLNCSLLSKGHCSGRGFKYQVQFQVRGLPSGFHLICRTAHNSRFPSVSPLLCAGTGQCWMVILPGRKYFLMEIFTQESVQGSCGAGSRVLSFMAVDFFLALSEGSKRKVVLISPEAMTKTQGRETRGAHKCHS